MRHIRNLLSKKQSAEIVEPTNATASMFREFSKDRVDEFYLKGYKKVHFFPHKVYFLPKSGPDGYKLAHRMWGAVSPEKLWEIVLFGTSPAIDEFPEELFFDDDLIWHQQHLGRVGQIAAADMVVVGDKLLTMAHQSDIVQRISRRRAYKSRIEKVFNGWHHMLLNSIMCFALENDIKQVYVPSATLSIENTDPKRSVQRELFERVYDRAVRHHFRVIKEGEWWRISVAVNRDRIVIPVKHAEIIKSPKIICLCHDIERGMGHIEVDPDFAESAERTSPRSLDEMLQAERAANFKATYQVVGSLFAEVRSKIEDGGNCLAFHSYDHDMSKEQLPRCRQVDFRIKGYRPPRSKISPELSDGGLSWHNFEWLASSVSSLGTKIPQMHQRIARIPIFFDDFDLYKRQVGYEQWEQKAIDTIKKNDFVAFSLHDCYAPFWLSKYQSFLAKIKGLGEIRTLDEVANDVILRSAV